VSDELGTTPPVSAKIPAAGRVLLAGVTVVIIAVLVVAGVWANARWGRHAMVTTGIAAVKAIVEGSATQLAAVSNATIRAQLTAATAAQMAKTGALADFSEPHWSGDVATMTATLGSGVGEIEVLPADDGANVVMFRTRGELGVANGALAMERSWTGWVVSGLTVGPAQKPANHPSVPGTSTVTTSTP
jgi:hypothetical protein